MAASNSIVIARASFEAVLRRPDPTPVTRDAVKHLHTSDARTGAFAKYLGSLAASFEAEKGKNGLVKGARAERKCLHILYLLHDLLHHAKHHLPRSSNAHASLTKGLQDQLSGIISRARPSGSAPSHRKQQRRLEDLLTIWSDEYHFDPSTLDKLQRAAEASDAVQPTDESEPAKAPKNVPYTLPATHGDPSTPWYDLPAGNILPEITPNSTRPIHPNSIKPIQFKPGPPEPHLISAVETLLKDVETMYTDESPLIDEGIVTDIDDMGQIMTKDEVTGVFRATESYYGWSIDFCEKMRKAKVDGPDALAFRAGLQRSESRSLSRSRSRSRSRSPHHKRRRSSSASSYRRERDRQGRRSRSRTRSPSRSRQRRRSPSEPPRPQPHTRAPPPPSQPPFPPYNQPSAPPLHTPTSQISDPFPPQPAPPPQGPSHQPHNFPIGPNGLPIPPPPPFHNGPWPPHMPGRMETGAGSGFQAGNGWGFGTSPPGGGAGAGATGGMFPPPPPPPPPPMFQGIYQSGVGAVGQGQGNGLYQGQGQWSGTSTPSMPQQYHPQQPRQTQQGGNGGWQPRADPRRRT
ncbi:MAG: hypothetical protein M1828_005031 [Chrysothrix sp. TS-e1954]|nr:MAG: hypothetical protein M1828_005031 [Chrysothrix sp. TS-e1954]